MSGLDNIKNKMQTLRLDKESAETLAEELKAKVKVLEQENLAKEQEITSLSHKNQLLETSVEKLEIDVKEARGIADETGQHVSHNEALQRKIQLLEDEAEEADKNFRETTLKYQQSDVKAGHYERKVQALEASSVKWEEKYEEMLKKYNDTLKELEDFQREIGSM